MLDHFRMLARYNSWANALVYDAVARLGDDGLHRDVGAYFGSINGTLNHVLVVDRLWIVRMTGDGEAPDSLDQVLYDDFADLAAARRAEDERLIAFADRLTEADLARPIRYRTVRTPLVEEQPMSAVLAHLFAHQIHHRGELRALLTAQGVKTVPFDLLYFQREESLKARAEVA